MAKTKHDRLEKYSAVCGTSPVKKQASDHCVNYTGIGLVGGSGSDDKHLGGGFHTANPSRRRNFNYF